ncbi:long-chain acyl-CoA synthetase [Saccharomonospora amisosensis]|uniref:Long-chain acyl-CoA synthetase n=1 Tax=Saccharomonospora amisosensis TaxID=1128677 RepID=A0A7X5ZQQ7_9PSEU|nr:AMP-binding protein [Saccharomonospora amisosensis]NIJ12099.1 long-chain acyl-CoA synthetase [Saccharomonospora amisosensis]
MTAPTWYDGKPWLALYDTGNPARIEPEHADALTMFRVTAGRVPDGDAIRYFDGRLSYARLDELSDAFAVGLLDNGLRRGDRVALYLQNVPQFVIALLGTWKAGGIAVPVNPMSRGRELRPLLVDSGAVALVCLRGLYPEAAAVLPDTRVRVVLTTSEREHQSRDDPRAFGAGEPPGQAELEGTTDLSALLERYRGTRPPSVSVSPDDVAVLTYTSGTTGPPKGAMNTHRNLVFNAESYRRWCRLDTSDVVLGVAPLFHITGMVGHVATALLLGAPLVLLHRFEPSLALDVIREQRPTFTVGSITVFIALLNAPNADPAALASLRKIWSGGAPIPPSTVTAFGDHFGQYIHNIYGLTETTSPSHAVPPGVRAPVDPVSGALSVGLPIYNTVARVVGDGGRELPPGEIGEIVTTGPQVVPGYWNKPRETEAALPGGALHTGDVGYMDAQGWFYLVDRKKDQINAAGYKVWPREVEDVLYEHGAVREAAVVGVPDPYRGETVKAFVSLRPGHHAEPSELIAFCRERLAAYKYPRQVEILDELPKTATGKLLRRELRQRHGEA